MDARRHLNLRVNPVERKVRTNAVLRAQQQEIVAVALTPLVVESGSPELSLALQIVDAHNDRADANHL